MAQDDNADNAEQRARIYAAHNRLPLQPGETLTIREEAIAAQLYAFTAPFLAAYQVGDFGQFREGLAPDVEPTEDTLRRLAAVIWAFTGPLAQGPEGLRHCRPELWPIVRAAFDVLVGDQGSNILICFRAIEDALKHPELSDEAQLLVVLRATGFGAADEGALRLALARELKPKKKSGSHSRGAPTVLAALALEFCAFGYGPEPDESASDADAVRRVRNAITQSNRRQRPR